MRRVTGLASATLVLVLASSALARWVEVRDQAPMRNGAGNRARIVGTLSGVGPAEVVGQNGGWLQVKLADGRVGWVFAANTKDVPDPPGTTPAPSAGTAPGAPDGGTSDPGRPASASSPTTAGTGTTLPSPVAPSAVDAPRAADDLASLRARVDALEATVESLRGRSPGDLPPTETRDGLVSLAIAALLVGLVFGWGVSRVAARRADRRQWNRVRL